MITTFAGLENKMDKIELTTPSLHNKNHGTQQQTFKEYETVYVSSM